MRINVLSQTSSHTCIICNGNNNLVRLSLKARVNIYLKRNIYASEHTKCCQNHLDDENLLLQELLQNLCFVNRPYVIVGTQLKPLLEELKNNCTSGTKYDNENNFTDDEFATMSPITKEQFRELFTYCDPIFEQQSFHYITKKHLLTFLCKMRQGLADEFLTFMFGYSSRQRTSTIIATVRTSLMLRFVPTNLGFNAINRDDFIQRHVTDFANQLYNPEPDVPRAIAYIDGTYVEVEKSSNFQTARQSYSMHKHHY